MVYGTVALVGDRWRVGSRDFADPVRVKQLLGVSRAEAGH